MKTSILSILLLMICLFGSCYRKADKGFAEGAVTTPSSIRDTIRKTSASLHDTLIMKTRDAFVKKINMLPIVRKYGNDLQRQMQGADVTYLILPFPSDTASYYIIEAGHSGPLRFEAIYHFYCYPESGEIRLRDTVGDSLISAGSIR